MLGSCFNSNDSSAANSRDLIVSKGQCGTDRGNIVVAVPKIYIQLQIGPDPDILVAGIGSPIEELSRGS